MTPYPPDDRILAALPVGLWFPCRATVEVTVDALFIVTLYASPASVYQRRFQFEALAPSRAADAAGSLVLVEHGERLVLPLGGSTAQLLAFADAIALVTELRRPR